MEIDRTKVCPFLLRCFWNLNCNGIEIDYQDAANDILPKNEVQIYTWPDATLKEISGLLADVIPDARHRNASIEFMLVYPDRNGNFIMKKIGVLHSERYSPDEEKTLASLRFQTGDFLDVGIYIGKYVGGHSRYK